jgi:hypothetical protein
MPIRRCVAALALAALAVPATAAAAPAKPLKLRLATTTKTITIPESDAIGGVFADSQRLSAKCKQTERPVAPGLISAPRPIAAQSFGFANISAFGVGQPGRVRFALQALCASGGSSTSVTSKRVEGRHVPGTDDSIGGLTTGRTTATARCGTGKIAIGAPLSQEFAPGLGRFVSKPLSPSAWQVQAFRVPDQLAANRNVPAFADVSCIGGRHIKLYQVVSATTTALHTATSATLTVQCPGARRPLGWGVDLRPYSLQVGTQDGRWLIPTVSRAQLTASSVAFALTLPEGATPAADHGLAEADVTQTVYVVCGALTGR